MNHIFESYSLAKQVPEKTEENDKNGGFIYLTFFATLWHQRVTNKRENREKKDNFEF